MSIIPTVKASDKQTLGELKKQYEDKLVEQKENNNKSEAAKEEIKQKEAAIKEAEKEIAEAEAEEQRVQKEIEESNKRIEKLKKETENILLYLQQMEGENAYVEYVSGASTITDLITRVAAIEQISYHTQETMKNLEEEIKKNEELKQELILKQENLKKQSEEYKKIIEQRYKDINNYDKYALDIDTQVKSLKEKLDTAKKNCEAYAPDLGDDAIISEDCVKKIYDANGNVITIDNGEWLKPLDYGFITSQIGSRWGSYHNALDIGGNAEWTPVKAAASGVVSGKIYRSSCGGNMLYIDVTVNGVPYTTYYYHLIQFNVELGDVVTQDTVIGYLGGGSTASYDSCTFGAHLHFGVAKGFYNGYSIPRENVITPPGFPNYEGWEFFSRYDWYVG